jgi:hypothetical protein
VVVGEASPFERDLRGPRVRAVTVSMDGEPERPGRLVRPHHTDVVVERHDAGDLVVPDESTCAG